MRKTLRNLSILLGCVLAGLLGHTWWVVRRSLPVVDGSLPLRGLQSSVEVLRDHIGVPHIVARSLDDLLMAQGFVTAQDRLWQMELMKRLSRGKLAEIFGRVALESDREHRVLGFSRAVVRQVRTLSATERRYLEQFAAGVNEFITSSPERIPVEFEILGCKPSLWTPEDTLLLNLWIGKTLTHSWEVDLMREAMAGTASPSARRQLLAEYSSKDLPVVGFDEPGALLSGPPAPFAPPTGQPVLQLDVGLRHRLSRLPNHTEAVLGSNNWVLAGPRTRSGKPLLANDPHLPHSVPSVWHMTHLKVPGVLDVAGVTVPGMPGIVLGHNDSVAWGATNNGADVQDVFVEKLHPEDKSRYRVRNQWLPMEVHEEVILVKDEAPVKVKAFATRHGPVIRQLDNFVLSLRWTLLDDQAAVPMLFSLGTARNWSEFLQAMATYAGPVQNFVYADRSGNIGFLNAGRVPVRKRGDGSVPVPGDTDEYEWTGYIPFAEMPRTLNPESGVLVTANNRVIGTSYQHFFTHNWFSPHRARRIRELIERGGRLGPEDMLRIQNDDYSELHELIAHRILEAIDSTQGGLSAPDDEGTAPPTMQFLQDELQHWDARAEPQSVASTVCEEFRLVLGEMVLRGVLGENWSSYRWQNRSTWMENLLDGHSPDLIPKGYSSLNHFVLTCFRESIRRLRGRFADSQPEGWRWGRYLPVEFKHPLGRFWPLTSLFNTGPFPQPGGPLAIRQAAPGVGVSLRMVIDFSDFDRSVSNLTLGQSGHPLSSHYRDQFRRWLGSDSFPMVFSENRIRKEATSRLVLVPASVAH
ncbi:MAG: penicillin acylase family protein [Acidobacteriota bacterium]